MFNAGILGFLGGLFIFRLLGKLLRFTNVVLQRIADRAMALLNAGWRQVQCKLDQRF